MNENKKITLLNEREHLQKNGIEQTEEVKNRMQGFMNDYVFQIKNNELFQKTPNGFKISSGHLIVMVENEDDGSIDTISWEWK